MRQRIETKEDCRTNVSFVQQPFIFRHKCPLSQQSRIEASVSHVFFAMIAPITAPAMIAVLTLPCEYFLPPLRFLR